MEIQFSVIMHFKPFSAGRFLNPQLSSTCTVNSDPSVMNFSLLCVLLCFTVMCAAVPQYRTLNLDPLPLPVALLSEFWSPRRNLHLDPEPNQKPYF